ncbi:MAG: hypothetical protein ABIK15_20395 [Pseudomonadota bacterium]
MRSDFIKSMGLFWVFAEMVILVYIRQGIDFVQGKKKKYTGLILFSGLVFVLLFLTAFRGEHFFSGYLDFNRKIHLFFYRYAVWHLFCTMWVVLEGSIMFYCLHAYILLKQSLYPKDHPAGSRGTMNPLTRYGIPLLVASSIAFFLFYEYRVFFIMERYGLEPDNLKSIYLFYIKICGMFWFMIEGTVACIGFKTYRLLKIESNGAHGIH